jgi:hypothetical protein
MDLPSFWANFWSGLVLLLIGSFLIPIYLKFRERPKIKLRNRISYGRKFEWTQALDKKWYTTLTLNIHNRGNKTLERFYWEIFVEKNTLAEAPEVAMKYPGNEWMRYETAGEYIRIYGYVETPIFSLESILFPYRIRITTDTKRHMNIYYYLKTDQGQLPFWAWIAVSYKKFFLLNKLTIN